MVRGTIGRIGKQRLWVIGLACVTVLVSTAILGTTNIPTSRGATQVAALKGAGPGTFVGTFKGNSAFANFSSVSSDGCVITDGFVGAAEQVTRPDNTTDQFVAIVLSKYDICTGTQLESASNKGNEALAGTVQFGSGLSSAGVSGTVELTDFVTNTTFPAIVNVTWQGYGDTTRSLENSHVHGPGFLFSMHFNGLSRAAVASGVLSDGTINWAATPSLYAELDHATGGSVSIIRP